MRGPAWKERRGESAISHISDSLLLEVEGSWELSAYYQRRTADVNHFCTLRLAPERESAGPETVIVESDT